MKDIFLIILSLFLSQDVFAANLLQLQCDSLITSERTFLEKAKNLFTKNAEFKYEKLILAKELRSGHTKSSSKNGEEPSAIFYDLQLGNFVSTTKQKDYHIELRYFTEGKLLVPECSGKVEVERKGFID